MNILVTGASGLLGHKVVQRATESGHHIYAVYNKHKATLGTPIQLDLTISNQLLKVLSTLKPDAIIHTAAYTDVDGCEVNRDRAWKENAEVTKYVALASASINSKIVYVSTDYVFDGEKGFYTEEDRPNPLSYYGYTKLQGENLVEKYSEDWCIARTSVIYGWGQRKENFATWLMNNLNLGKRVKTLTDQYVSPTLNTNLADMLLEITEKRVGGILHTAGAARISRYDFALKLAHVFNLDKSLIEPAAMNDILWKAQRPKDSSLNVNKTQKTLNTKPLELDNALKCMKKETIGQRVRNFNDYSEI